MITRNEFWFWYWGIMSMLETVIFIQIVLSSVPNTDVITFSFFLAIVISFWIAHTVYLMKLLEVKEEIIKINVIVKTDVR